MGSLPLSAVRLAQIPSPTRWRYQHKTPFHFPLSDWMRIQFPRWILSTQRYAMRNLSDKNNYFWRADIWTETTPTDDKDQRTLIWASISTLNPSHNHNSGFSMNVSATSICISAKYDVMFALIFGFPAFPNDVLYVYTGKFNWLYIIWHIFSYKYCAYFFRAENTLRK